MSKYNTPNMNMFYLLIAISATYSCTANAFEDKVLLKDVDSLVLSSGKRTTGRRSLPVQQLHCKNNCIDIPDSVLCKNVGADDRDVVWKCQGDLNEGIKFVSLNVICEGYDHKYDPYILSGSCGLEYSLSRSPNTAAAAAAAAAEDDGSKGGFGVLIIMVSIIFLVGNSDMFWGILIGVTGATVMNSNRSSRSTSWSSGDGYDFASGFASTSRR